MYVEQTVEDLMPAETQLYIREGLNCNIPMETAYHSGMFKIYFMQLSYSEFSYYEVFFTKVIFTQI